MVTTIEDGLKRLLRLCPRIILDPISIQLIIDGKTNQVIAEYNDALNDPVINEKIDTSDGNDTPAPKPITKKTTKKKKKSLTKKIANDIIGEIKKDKKAFNEYF